MKLSLAKKGIDVMLSMTPGAIQTDFGGGAVGAAFAKLLQL